VEISFGPSAVATINFMDGTVSPTLIVIVWLLPVRVSGMPRCVATGFDS
jgi:hypothetical protein